MTIGTTTRRCDGGSGRRRHRPQCREHSEADIRTAAVDSLQFLRHRPGGQRRPQPRREPSPRIQIPVYPPCSLATVNASETAATSRSCAVFPATSKRPNHVFRSSNVRFVSSRSATVARLASHFFPTPPSSPRCCCHGTPVMMPDAVALVTSMLALPFFGCFDFVKRPPDT